MCSPLKQGHFFTVAWNGGAQSAIWIEVNSGRFTVGADSQRLVHIRRIETTHYMCREYTQPWPQISASGSLLLSTQSLSSLDQILNDVNPLL